MNDCPKEKKPHIGYWTWMYQRRQLFIFPGYSHQNYSLFHHLHSLLPWASGCCRKEEVKMFFGDPHVGLPVYADVDYITWCHGNAQKPPPTIMPSKLFLRAAANLLIPWSGKRNRRYSVWQDAANLPAEHLEIDTVFDDVFGWFTSPRVTKEESHTYSRGKSSCKLVCKCALIGIRVSKDFLPVVVVATKNNPQCARRLHKYLVTQKKRPMIAPWWGFWVVSEAWLHW